MSKFEKFINKKQKEEKWNKSECQIDFVAQQWTSKITFKWHFN